MSDQNSKYVSEEMVKLIFSPIKETLLTTTQAIVEVSNHIRDLVNIATLPPSRADILEKLLESINKHEGSSNQREKELKEYLIEKIYQHERNIEPLIDNLREIVLELKTMITPLLGEVDELNTLSSNLSNQIRIHIDNNNTQRENIENCVISGNHTYQSLYNKMNQVLWVISTVFGISMIAWGVFAYIFIKLPQ